MDGCPCVWAILPSAWNHMNSALTNYLCNPINYWYFTFWFVLLFTVSFASFVPILLLYSLSALSFRPPEFLFSVVHPHWLMSFEWQFSVPDAAQCRQCNFWFWQVKASRNVQTTYVLGTYGTEALSEITAWFSQDLEITLFSQDNDKIQSRSWDNESNVIGLRFPSHMTSCRFCCYLEKT